MKIAITGSGGLIGRRLRDEFPDATFIPLVRDRAREGVYWNPRSGEIDTAQLEGLDAVIHLAGEPVLGRWTDAKRERILKSREDGTRLLCEALAGLERPPAVLLSASAMGIYDDTGDTSVNEDTPAGTGFLQSVCVAWESATAPAEAAGIRVCHMRIGVVLSREGGALKQMMLPFKLGLGGRVGNGRQYMSWISIHDIAGAVRFLLETKSARGPFNLTAPAPATNTDFTKAFGRAIKRPTIFPVPAFVLRIIFGEMSNVLLLGSFRVRPKRLLEEGYQFRHPTLEGALSSALE